MSSASILAKQGRVNFVSRVTALGSRFAQLIVLTNLASPAVVGLYTLVLSTVIVIQRFADLSLNEAVDYFLPGLLENSEHRSARFVLYRVVALSLFSTATAVTLVALGVGGIATVLSAPQIETPLVLAAILIPLQSMGSIADAVFITSEQTQYKVLINIFYLPSSTFYYSP